MQKEQPKISTEVDENHRYLIAFSEIFYFYYFFRKNLYL